MAMNLSLSSSGLSASSASRSTRALNSSQESSRLRRLGIVGTLGALGPFKALVETLRARGWIGLRHGNDSSCRRLAGSENKFCHTPGDIRCDDSVSSWLATRPQGS